MPVTGEHN